MWCGVVWVVYNPSKRRNIHLIHHVGFTEIEEEEKRRVGFAG
jgi:hypothetical protein